MQEMQKAPEETDPADIKKGNPGLRAGSPGSCLALSSDGSDSDSLHRGGSRRVTTSVLPGARQEKEGKKEADGLPRREVWPYLRFAKGAHPQDFLPTPNRPTPSLHLLPQHVLLRALMTEGGRGLSLCLMAKKTPAGKNPNLTLPRKVPGHSHPDLDVTLLEKEDIARRAPLLGCLR